MIPGFLVALSLLAGPTAASTPSTDPCAGVVDRTATCPSPSSVAADILTDTKRAPEKIAGIEPEKLPGELAFLGLGLAVGGGATLAMSYANTPSTDDERLWRDVGRWSGAGLLVWSGLTAAGAFSLWVFNPATGEMRPQIFPERE